MHIHLQLISADFSSALAACCCGLHCAFWLSLVGAVKAERSLVLMYIFARLTVILIQICVQACVFIWYVYTSLGYMTLAVEMSVTTKKKIKV